MARFYDPTDGAISFGGVDLRNVDEATLRERIVVIPQEGFLFTGTIRDNLLMAAPDADDARIRAALDDLGLAERFDASRRASTRGSRRAARTSRRASASWCRWRAAGLIDPSVLVLDEATSSLDPGYRAAARPRAGAADGRAAPSS